MSEQKHILLFGAGKSATVLIEYLKELSIEKQWQVTVADRELAVVESKIGEHPLVKAKQVDLTDAADRGNLISSADVVITLLPPALQYPVAMDCLERGKHFLSASYTDPQIQLLANQIEQKGILFLAEMGLDPGIDHMSAMQMINHIKSRGGQIQSFRSHCGGLVAPSADNNPWHYKFSWNPRNVVIAGKAGATYRENGKTCSKPYQEVFDKCETVFIEGLGELAMYPNRDSLSYIPTYDLEETKTFIRTTLRYPDYCLGWNRLIAVGLTNEDNMIDSDGLSIGAFFQQHFKQHGINIAGLSEKENILFTSIGLFDETLVNRGSTSSADILQWILENKWALAAGDTDMIVMLHEIKYSLNDINKLIKSQLVVIGKNSLQTAMAQTVGLPLGIAASLLLEGTIQVRGLHIPTLPAIYEPVLTVLKERGISFVEGETLC
jgi:saccharopine dehydrogenase (NADP+, L-glutamate forming)